jgi:Kef-type K+ transport system membrane component KefB
VTGPFAAAGAGPGESDPIAGLLAVAVLFIGAKVGEEIARRLGQPGVVGELAGGFLVGPHALGLVTPGDAALVLAELGVVILLFKVGLEVRVDQLLAVGRAAAGVAIVGAVLPFAGAAAAMVATGAEPGTAAFVGLALAATSIGITARVMRDLGAMDTTFGRIILGAAVIDDILALIAIGVLSGLVAGNLSASTLLVVVSAVGLIGLGFAMARRARGLRREAFTWPLFADTPLVPAFILMLLFALLAAAIGLAAIIGAFVAGLIVAETEASDEIEHEMRPLEQIFAPFFFAVAGAAVDLQALFVPALAALAIGLAAIGIVTKLAAGIVVRARGRWTALAVGAGMVPRGEVGIIVADIGLVAGLLAADVFSAVIVAVVLTTLIAPVLLYRFIPRATREGAHS